MCGKASHSKRDVFDAQAQRLHGTEAAEVILKQPQELSVKQLNDGNNKLSKLRRNFSDNINNASDFGSDLITTIANWKSPDRDKERAENHGALRQCFCCFFCCCCWASSDSKKPEVETNINYDNV